MVVGNNGSAAVEEVDHSKEAARFTELITAPEEQGPDGKEDSPALSLLVEVDALENIAVELVECWTVLHNAFDEAGLLGAIAGPTDNSKAPQPEGKAATVKRVGEIGDVLRDLISAMRKDNARLQL